MDAQGYDYEDIIRKVKIQCPTLTQVGITIEMLHIRLEILDHRIDLDYFRRGMEKSKKRSKVVVSSRGSSRHQHAEPKGKGKAKARPTASQEGAGDSSTQAGLGDKFTLQHKSSSSDLQSRGALHGQSMTKSCGQASSSQGHNAGQAAPFSSSHGYVETNGARHGKLIHDAREEVTTAGVSSPMANNIPRTGSSKGRGVEHGQAMYHDRTQSNVSSAFSGTTAVIPPIGEENSHAPEGLVYTRPPTPAVSEATTTVHVGAAALPLPVNPTPACLSVETEDLPTRAARLGRAIHSSPGQSLIPVSKGKLRVTNTGNADEQERATTPTPQRTGASKARTSTDTVLTPNEFRRKRSVTQTPKAMRKENERGNIAALSPGLEQGEPGPSTLAPKPLSIKQSVTTAGASVKKDRVYIAESDSGSRKSHEMPSSLKVGNTISPGTAL